jgi:DNA processing protein
MECGLPTIAVMATGPDSIYPARHGQVARQIVEAPGSALVTDYPPGTAPLAVHFLRRNRIIAGLSEAVVLIESKIKGGGMMTARLADSYNRDVFALPGRVDDIRSQGCNFLIRNKTASPLISIEDFIKEMGMTSGRKNRKESDTDRLARLYKGSLTDDRITVMSRILLAIRKEKGISIDEIAVRLGLEYHKVAQLTGMLETDGVITTDLLQRCFINFR